MARQGNSNEKMAPPDDAKPFMSEGLDIAGSQPDLLRCTLTRLVNGHGLAAVLLTLVAICRQTAEHVAGHPNVARSWRAAATRIEKAVLKINNGTTSR
jgi:hypothetical protein